MPSLQQALQPDLQRLRDQSLFRETRASASAPGTTIERAGRKLLNFGSNNYLGLTQHPDVRAAACEAMERWGTGASGSRLTSGSLDLHAELEAALAELKSAERALLFPSGYQANLGAIPALVGPDDLILSDALNHASLIDGCRLSRAQVRVYRHGDVENAAQLMKGRNRFRRVLVVTDGVFSMDGDLAPLPALCDLCGRHDAWLMVDDAHGTGVLGETGAGAAEHLGVADRVDIRMGTLSKALAAEGGFVAGSSELIDTLVNRARAFIFATSPAPATVAAALAALRVMQADPELRSRLRDNAEYLRAGLRAAGLRVADGITPIIPVVVGAPEMALRMAARLEELGVWAPAIRPPTVPDGTSRLRVSVMTTHKRGDLDRAIAAFGQAAQECALR